MPIFISIYCHQAFTNLQQLFPSILNNVKKTAKFASLIKSHLLQFQHQHHVTINIYFQEELSIKTLVGWYFSWNIEIGEAGKTTKKRATREISAYTKNDLWLLKASFPIFCIRFWFLTIFTVICIWIAKGNVKYITFCTPGRQRRTFDSWGGGQARPCRSDQLWPRMWTGN